jgi:asparagine N-glycosylation enzyme membrane subunit Stt3
MSLLTLLLIIRGILLGLPILVGTYNREWLVVVTSLLAVAPAFIFASTWQPTVTTIPFAGLYAVMAVRYIKLRKLPRL